MSSRSYYKNETSITYFGEGDSTIPYRLVGSYEYQNALESFEQLASNSTPEEVKVYDKLIGMRDEFSIMSGASLTGSVANNASNQQLKSKFKTTHTKQSLAWLVALARVELGATISMYGESKDPFGEVVKSNFGAQEYMQILLDDIGSHIKSLQADQGFQKAVSPNAELDEDTLAYLRRIRLVSDMLEKVLQVNDPNIAAIAQPFSFSAYQLVEQIVDKIDSQTGLKSERTDLGSSTRPLSSNPVGRDLRDRLNRSRR